MALPSPLTASLRAGVAYRPTGETTPLHSNVSLEEANKLYTLVRERKPKRTLEIGFGQGISAAAILQALQENGTGEHIVIDPFQKKFEYAGLGMVRRCGLEARMQFHERFPEEVIPSLEGKFGFAFIDASHLFDLSIVDFVLADKVLEVGGLLGFHDLWMPSLQKVVRYIVTNREYEMADPFPAEKEPWLRGLALKAARLIPKSERLFAEGVLRPWSSIARTNMVMLHKRADDSRDWRYHQRF